MRTKHPKRNIRLTGTIAASSMATLTLGYWKKGTELKVGEYFTFDAGRLSNPYRVMEVTLNAAKETESVMIDRSLDVLRESKSLKTEVFVITDKNVINLINMNA